MKKITFIFVGIIYAAAIIVIAFLGVSAGVYDQTINVTSIVLNEAVGLGKGQMVTYPKESALLDSVYALLTRPEESAISPSTGRAGGVLWNMNGTNYDYIIQIRGFNTVYESPNWKYGPRHFDLGAHAEPDDATRKDVTYRLTYLNGNVPENITIDSLGVITFEEKLTDAVTNFRVTISATDNSNVVCNVFFAVVGYK